MISNYCQPLSGQQRYFPFLSTTYPSFLAAPFPSMQRAGRATVATVHVEFFLREAEPQTDYYHYYRAGKSRKTATIWGPLVSCGQILRQHLPANWLDYLLPLVMLKYVSDFVQQKHLDYIHQFPAQSEKIAQSLAAERFVLPSLTLPVVVTDGTSVRKETVLANFASLLRRREQADIGLQIDAVLEALARANPHTMQSLFSHLSYDDATRLGNPTQRQAMWRTVLQELARLQLQAEAARVELAAHCWQMAYAPQPNLAGVEALTSSVVQLLWRLYQPPANSRVCDPFSGSGQFLLAAQQNGADCRFFAQEHDTRRCANARLGLLLHGKDEVQLSNSNAFHQPLLQADGQLQQFDILLSNLVTQHLQWDHKLARSDHWQRYAYGIAPKGKPELACVSHMLAAAQAHTGRVAVLLASGCLFRGGPEQNIRQKIIEKNLLDAVILLPAKATERKQRSLALLLLDWHRAASPSEALNSEVLMIDARQEMASGQILPQLQATLIDTICRVYQTRSSLPGYARLVSGMQIAKHGYNYLPSVYCQHASGVPDTDIDALETEIQTLKKESLMLQAELEQQLQQLLAQTKPAS